MTNRNVIHVSEEAARKAKALGLDLSVLYRDPLLSARAKLRSPLYQSNEDLRQACGVLHRLGDPQDGEMARQMLLVLARQDLQSPQAPPSNFKASLFLAVALCAGTLVVLAVGEWWLL
jgi:hypothetical protein